MREKGGHFVLAFAFALAAHALLFLLLVQLLRGNAAANAGGVRLVEIQLSRMIGEGGDAGLSGKGLRRAPSLGTSSAHPPSQPPAQLPKSPAPTQALKPPPAPQPTPTPQPSQPASLPSSALIGEENITPAQGPAIPSPQEEGNLAAGGAGVATHGPREDVGEVSDRTGGSIDGTSADLPVTIADIDPVPLGPIIAAYPPAARRLGQQGLVKVRADVDDKGTVVSEQISLSSGFAWLDNAALDAVKNARFLPAKKNGKSILASIIVPIRFKLTSDRSSE
jgi:protein TonB